MTDARAVMAVVLAAGAGTRFAGPHHKLSAPIDGTPVITHAVRSALASGIGPVRVIAGAFDPSPLLGELSAEFPDADLRVINCSDWQLGQSASLQAAIDEARSADVDAVVVTLGDQPYIKPAAYQTVAASTADLAVALYPTTPPSTGHPVRISRALWGELPTQGDEGARSLLQRAGASLERLPCPGSPADIDTLEDLPHG